MCITDASPTGGGGAVSREFKPPPDLEVHDGRTCWQCGGPLSEDYRYRCPAGCGVAVCCWECSQEHRATNCRRKLYPVPKFGERFSGPNAPLSRAVAKVGGVKWEGDQGPSTCEGCCPRDGVPMVGTRNESKAAEGQQDGLDSSDSV